MKDAYINGKIIDGTKEMQVKEEYAILVEQGKIKDVVLQEEADLTGYNVVNLKGNYIMPGLINMHVHLAGNGKPQKKQRDNAKLVNFLMSNPLTRAIAHNMVSGFAEMELLSGVTTIRTVGGIRDFDTRVRDEINCGKKIGPRILAGNEGISVPHGHMAGSVAIAAETIADALLQVSKAKEQNVDLIKLMITGGVLNDKDELLVVRRKNDPGKDMLDMPGGFIDMDETGEEGMAREVKEETGLEATEVTYQFSYPNTYLYSGFVVHTLDLFFKVKVKDLSHVEAMDDAAAYYWIPLSEIHIEDFAFDSIRKGLKRFLATENKSA